MNDERERFVRMISEMVAPFKADLVARVAELMEDEVHDVAVQPLLQYALHEALEEAVAAGRMRRTIDPDGETVYVPVEVRQ
jgi:hypothetical protein